MTSIGGATMRDLSAAKLALMAERVRAQRQDLDVLRAEPIAIVGIGCRFPGAPSPDAFWQLLHSGGDAITEVPADRWDVDALHDPALNAPGKMTTRSGGFLEHVDTFDPAFFGLSPREATRMDPQQRLLLEVAYEAIEDAGLTRERLAGSKTGVYVASTAFDYAHLQLSDRESISAHTVTGSVHCILANRLSFLFDLQGPSLALDTACSSSLVAIHLACQGLRGRETEIAVAGGVNLILSPEIAVSLSKWGMMAADGRCKTFDARADGFVRAEGCGIVVLKRLADALADGDAIHAVVRGSAVNQDGRSSALTAPNGLAQQAVIRAALEQAGLAPDQISYVEAHGTGTVLGDPIEVEALAEVYGRPRDDGQPLVVGAVKTNIGHLEAAAGVAGLIKVILALKHGQIPQNLHFEHPNPHIALDGSRLVFPSAPQTWDASRLRRIAGVSSFGFGGTNAHVLVEEPPPLPPVPPVAPGPVVVPLSAHNDAALRQRASDLRDFLRDPSLTVSPADVAYTAATRRSHYDHRLVVVGESRSDLAERLQNYLDDEPQVGWKTGVRAPGKPPRIAFVFSGQGPQWWAMGRELLNESDVFRAEVEAVDQRLSALAGWSVLAELTTVETESRLDQTEIAQPALFALQAGLVGLWRSWGVDPNAVIGHSVGEIAAAYAAGVLDLDAAVRVAFHRGRLMQAATGQGQMAAVELSAEEVESLLSDGGYGDRLALAAINGPASVVLSGESTALFDVLATLARRGVTHRVLPVRYAFHSPQMAPFAEELVGALGELRPMPAILRLASTVTGRAAVHGQDYDAAYWGRNVRQGVRFADAVGALLDEGVTAFVEIGPHPVLSTNVQQCLDARGQTGVVAHSLRRGQPERATLLSNLGALFARGCAVDWERLHAEPGTVIALPAYPWQRQRYWFEPGAAMPVSVATGASGHPLLGRRLRSPALRDEVFEAVWSVAHQPLLADHRLFDEVVAPATALIDVLTAAAEYLFGGGPHRIEALAIQQALLMPDPNGRVVQVIARRTGSDAAEAEVVSGALDAPDGADWARHASARLVATGPDEPEVRSLDDARAACTNALDVDAYYAHLDAVKIQFGPAFRGLVTLARTPDGQDAVGRIVASERVAADAGRHTLHPALLDSAFQTLGSTFLGDGQQDIYLPLGVDSIDVFEHLGSELWCVAKARPIASAQPEIRSGDLALYDAEGRRVARLTGIHLKRASNAALHRRGEGKDAVAITTVHWEPAPIVAPPAVSRHGRWLILADTGGLGEALARRLRAEGDTVVLAFAGDASVELGGGAWRIAVAQPDGLRAALRSSDEPWRGVVHLWGLDEPGAEFADTPQARQMPATAGLLHAAQTCAELAAPPRLWLVTRGAQAVDTGAGFDRPALDQAPAWGLAATVALEHPELAVTCVDLDPLGDRTNPQHVWDELRRGDGEDRLAYRDDLRLAARLIPVEVAAPSVSADPVCLVSNNDGLLDTLRLEPFARRGPGPGEVEIVVHAAGLGFRDVLNALGLYPGDAGPLGGECAGVVSAVGPNVSGVRVGDEVMAVAVGAMRSHVVTRAEFVARKPAGLTFAAAAGLPSVFLTALHGLIDRAQLRRGERILVHAAAGGVGLAAVQVARRVGAVVLGTAGSPHKRAFLETEGVMRAMDSRSLAFVDEIEAITLGDGVDVVLNALASEFIPASFAALSPSGRFVEIGKRDIWTSAQVAAVRPAAEYHPFDLGQIMRDDPGRIHDLLTELVRAVEAGELRPLPTRTFKLSDAAAAFRFMAQARHIGKIVLVPDEVDASVPVRADGTYLIAGGLGALGLAVAAWLVERGARHIALLGRSAPSSSASAAIRDLEAAGARVLTLSVDLGSREQLVAALTHIRGALPELRGVIHAAGVLDDGPIGQQSWERFAPVLRPKVDGAWNLHDLTQTSPLDLFILFSSASVWLGSSGQASYAVANAYLDALAQQRRWLGRPALSVGWGPWAGDGMAGRLGPADRQRLERRGLGHMPPALALEALDVLWRSGAAQALALKVDWTRYAQRETPLCRRLVPHAATPAAAKPTKADLLQSIAAAPPGRVRGMLLAHTRALALRVLGLNAGQAVDPRQPLQELGLDSLMAVELRNALGASLERALPTTLLFDYPTLDALTDYLLPLVGNVAAAPPAPTAAPSPAPRADAAEVANLTEEEAEALLLEELSQLKREARHG